MSAITNRTSCAVRRRRQQARPPRGLNQFAHGLRNDGPREVVVGVCCAAKRNCRRVQLSKAVLALRLSPRKPTIFALLNRSSAGCQNSPYCVRLLPEYSGRTAEGRWGKGAKTWSVTRLTVFVVLLCALAACIGLFKPTDRSLRVKRLLSQQLRVPLAALRSKEISAIDVDRTR